jgi:multidrug efflux system membrane fusion protein
MSFFVAPSWIQRLMLIALLTGFSACGVRCALAEDTAPSSAQNSVQATLAWAEVTRLSTPVSGVVASIPVRAGQIVDKGALLLRLDITPFADRLAVVHAERAGLMRAAAEAKRDAQRTQALFDRTVASESERQDALIKQEKIQAELDAVKARVNLRQWEQARSELVAPFTARILSVDTAVGETVSSELNAPVLLRIARADAMVAEANLTPSAAMGVRLGQTLTVQVAQTQVSGQVVSIASEPSAQGTSYRLRVQFQPEKDWVAGLPAQIALP